MAIFANSAATQTTTVTNSATQIFNTSATGIPVGAALKKLTVMNTGSVNVYLGQSGVTSSTGLLLAPGQQVTYNNSWSYVRGSATGNVYAITASGTCTVVAGLATVNANV